MDSIGLIVGHTPDEPGATNGRQQVSEWHYNITLARMVRSQLENSYLILRGRPNDWDGLPGRVNRTGGDFAVSFHLNAYSGDATGSEVLHWHSSRESARLAQRLQDQFIDLLDTKDRGVKPVESGDRGARLLRDTVMPIVIAEPFFIDDQLAEMQPKTAEVAAAYVAALQKYRSTAT